MAHIGGDRFRAAWRELMAAMREDADTNDIDAVRVYRDSGRVEMTLTFSADSAFSRSIADARQ